MNLSEIASGGGTERVASNRERFHCKGSTTSGSSTSRNACILAMHP